MQLQFMYQATGTAIPLDDLDEAKAILEKLVTKYGLECTPPRSVARLLDKLVAHFIEDNKVCAVSGDRNPKCSIS